MSKWSHLFEADERLRQAEVTFRSTGAPSDALRFAYEIIRAPLHGGGMRFDRLMREFMGDQTEEHARRLAIDYLRVTGRPDAEESRTCMLRGKQSRGRVCHQANQTQVTTRYFVILVSYTTPVAYMVRATGDVCQTDTRFSVTTTGHVSRWVVDNTTGATRARTVPQREIAEIYRDI